MDKQTLNEYKFMDTPEFKEDKKKSVDLDGTYHWLLNNLIRGDD